MKQVLFGILLLVFGACAQAAGVVKLDGAQATFACAPPTTRTDGTIIPSTSVLSFALYISQDITTLGKDVPFSSTTGTCAVTKSTAGLALGQWHSCWTALEIPASPNKGGPESKCNTDSPFYVDVTPVIYPSLNTPGNIPVK